MSGQEGRDGQQRPAKNAAGLLQLPSRAPRQAASCSGWAGSRLADSQLEVRCTKVCGGSLRRAVERCSAQHTVIAAYQAQVSKLEAAIKEKDVEQHKATVEAQQACQLLEKRAQEVEALANEVQQVKAMNLELARANEIHLTVIKKHEEEQARLVAKLAEIETQAAETKRALDDALQREAEREEDSEDYISDFEQSPYAKEHSACVDYTPVSISHLHPHLHPYPQGPEAVCTSHRFFIGRSDGSFQEVVDTKTEKVKEAVDQQAKPKERKDSSAEEPQMWIDIPWASLMPKTGKHLVHADGKLTQSLGQADEEEKQPDANPKPTNNSEISAYPNPAHEAAKFNVWAPVVPKTYSLVHTDDKEKEQSMVGCDLMGKECDTKENPPVNTRLFANDPKPAKFNFWSPAQNWPGTFNWEQVAAERGYKYDSAAVDRMFGRAKPDVPRQQESAKTGEHPMLQGGRVISPFDIAAISEEACRKRKRGAEEHSTVSRLADGVNTPDNQDAPVKRHRLSGSSA